MSELEIPEQVNHQPEQHSDWQLIPATTLKQVHDQLKEVFENTYHEDFENEWMGVNHQLQVELRALKYVDGWVTGFLLTPWMLCSIFVPVMQTPDIEVDNEWQAAQRENKDYMVIGPLKEFSIAGQMQKGNLNYDSRIGHYLLQPLVQIMDKYPSNEQAFAAWSEVIEFRKAHYEKLEQEMEALQEAEAPQVDENEPMDRRAFLSKWI